MLQFTARCSAPLAQFAARFQRKPSNEHVHCASSPPRNRASSSRTERFAPSAKSTIQPGRCVSPGSSETVYRPAVNKRASPGRALIFAILNYRFCINFQRIAANRSFCRANCSLASCVSTLNTRLVWLSFLSF